MLCKVALLFLPLLFLIDGARGECTKAPCGDDKTNTKRACENYETEFPIRGTLRKYKLCCWDETPGLKPAERCRVDSRKAENLDITGLRREFEKTAKKPPIDEKKLKADVDALQKIPPKNDLGITEQKTRSIKSSAARHLSIGGSPFGALPGSGGFGGGGLLSLLAIGGFPECPVDIKICYRTPCGGYRSQNDPQACLADPTCCYDYNLVFYRGLFGPRYMGDAPACYIGATSQQWLYVTQLLGKWNPWLTPFILKTFDSIFDLALINIQGKLACKFDFLETACPGGVTKKRDCNLKDCCWDKKTKSCTKASSVVLQSLGSTQVYPSLYTTDPLDTQCPNTILDYTPRAYKRQPCSVGDPPDDYFGLFSWCPNTECCLNYFALKDLSSSSSGLALLLASGGLGGSPQIGGFPQTGGLPGLPGGGGAGFNPLLLGALSGDKSGSTLDKLFCPYYIFKISSSFPELNAEGCCDIPACFYKKKYHGSGFGPVQPPHPQPPHPQPPHPPTVYGRYGSWSQCSGPCGSYGRRTRDCLVNGRSSPGSCSGPYEEQCQTGPCVEAAQWSDYTFVSCGVTCGSGPATYRRQCLRYGSPVNPAECGGGPTTETRTCNRAPCAQRYQWGGEMRVIGTCERSCTGRQMVQQSCISGSGQVVEGRYCTGTPNQEYRSCPPPPCQGHQGSGGGYGGAPIELCRAEGTSQQYKVCVSVNECPPPPPTPQGPKYFWTGYGPWSSCQIIGGRCQRKKERTCYEPAGNTYVKVKEQSHCGGYNDRIQTEDCNYNECPFQG